MRLGDAGYAQPLAVFFDQSLDLQLAVDSKALLPKADTPACTGASTDRDARSACLVARVAAATAYTGPNGWGADGNCQVSPVAKLQCIRKAGGVPVIFADPRPLPATAPQTIPESALLAALGEVAMLSPVVLSEHRYALVGPQALVQRTNVAGWQLSPAALLYLVYCYQDAVTGDAAKAAPNAAKPDHRNCPDALTPGYQQAMAKTNHWPQTLEAPLEITSGVHPESRFDASISNVQAGTRASNCWIADAQHRNLWKIMSSQLAPALFADAQRPCTYPDELDATVLASKAMALYPDARDMFFRNRLILVGESFEVSPDRPELEPFGRVPGVFVHAMATDNLIERGENYPHGLDPVGSTALSLLAVFVVTTVTALFVAIAKDLRVWSARLLIGSLWAALTVGLLLALTRFTPPLRVEGFNYVFVFVFIFAGFVEVVSAILIIPLLKDFLRFMVGDKRKTVQAA
jgi:hypothetical protein